MADHFATDPDSNWEDSASPPRGKQSSSTEPPLPNGGEDPHITDDGTDSNGPVNELRGHESGDSSPIKALAGSGSSVSLASNSNQASAPQSNGAPPQLQKPDTIILPKGTSVLAPLPLMGLQESTLEPAEILEFRYKDPKTITGWHAKSYSVDRMYYVLQYRVKFQASKRCPWVDGDFVIPFSNEDSEQEALRPRGTKRTSSRRRSRPVRLEEQIARQVQEEEKRRELAASVSPKLSTPRSTRPGRDIASKCHNSDERTRGRTLPRSSAAKKRKAAGGDGQANGKRALQLKRNIHKSKKRMKCAVAGEQKDRPKQSDETESVEKDNDGAKFGGGSDQPRSKPYTHYEVFGDVHGMVLPNSLPTSQLTHQYLKLTRSAGSLRSGRVFVAVSDQGSLENPILGLFAGEDIPKNEPITTYGGVLRTAKHVRSLGKQYLTHTRRIPSCIFVLDGRIWSQLWDRCDFIFLSTQRALPSPQRQKLLPQVEGHPLVQPEHIHDLSERIMTSGIGYMSNTGSRQEINCRVRTVTPRKDGIGPGELVLISTSFIPAGSEILSPYNNHDPEVAPARLSSSCAPAAQDV